LRQGRGLVAGDLLVADRLEVVTSDAPHNLEAEEAVLGAILAAGRLLAEVAEQLEEADFYRPAHRAIWRAVLRLADR
jgi:replicative DNA helicase